MTIPSDGKAIVRSVCIRQGRFPPFDCGARSVADVVPEQVTNGGMRSPLTSVSHNDHLRGGTAPPLLFDTRDFEIVDWD